MSNSSLTLENLYLYAEGKCGISGENNDNDVLTIRRSYVEATGSEGSVCGISGLTLEESFIQQPENAVYNKQRKSVTLNGETVTDKVVVEPTIMYYGLRICGASVSTRNYNDLSVIDGVKGKLSYNPDTKILTMEDCTINSVFSGIIITGEDITVEVLGNNSITTENVCITGWNKPCNISGSGTLRLKSAESAGIYAFCSQTVIEGIKLYTEGLYGIGGYDGESGEELIVRNAYVEATGSNGSICDFQNVVLDGCSITQPAGAAFEAGLHAVAQNGEKVTDIVMIEPDKYGIQIAGVAVTGDNRNDLSVINGVEGNVNYDPQTNTLTLEDATISSADDNGILVNDYVKILIKGTNTIDSHWAGLCVEDCSSSISGSGTLVLKSDDHWALSIDNSDITIEDVKISAEGMWGIAGTGKSTAALTIRNAYVEVTGTNGSVTDITNLILEGCSIKQPEGAVYDAEKKAVALNGEVVKDKVVIASDASGINDITADVPARKQGIFTVQGVKQTQSWNELPAGIYIVDGVKRVKK